LFRWICLEVIRCRSWRLQSLSIKRLERIWGAHVSQQSRVSPRYLTFWEWDRGWLLRNSCGPSLGHSVKVECSDFVWFNFRPHSVYHVASRSKGTAMSGSEWHASSGALSSAKSATIVFWVVGWSAVYMLKRSGAITAPCGTPASI